MFCRKCGNQLNEGADFCPKCGNRVSNMDRALFKSETGQGNRQGAGASDTEKDSQQLSARNSKLPTIMAIVALVFYVISLFCGIRNETHWDGQVWSGHTLFDVVGSIPVIATIIAFGFNIFTSNKAIRKHLIAMAITLAVMFFLLLDVCTRSYSEKGMLSMVTPGIGVLPYTISMILLAVSYVVHKS